MAAWTASLLEVASKWELWVEDLLQKTPHMFSRLVRLSLSRSLQGAPGFHSSSQGADQEVLCVNKKKYFYILKPQTQTFIPPRNFYCRVLYAYEQSFWYILDQFPAGFHHKIDNGGIFKTSKKVSVTGDINWNIFFVEFEKLCMCIFELKKDCFPLNLCLASILDTK